ncbi:MAG: hypothetical protein ABSA02_08415 [Trebonia sp.]
MIADVAVAGHDHPHAGRGREQSQALPVAAERVRRVGVEQRDLNVGEHVAGDQHAGLRQVDRAVAGGVGVVGEHHRARPGPLDVVAEQRLDAGEQRQVVARGLLPHAVDEPRQFPGGDRDRARGGIPGHVAERDGPEQVIPVRVRGPSRHRVQAALRQPVRDRGEVADGHRRVDEQAPAVGAGHHRGRRGVPVGRRDEDAGRYLMHASPRYRRAPRRDG